MNAVESNGMSVRGILTRLWCWEPLRRGVTLYLLMRIGLSLWATLVLAIVPAETGPSDPARPYLGIVPVDEGWAGLLLGPWQRFDTLHYVHLATHGYEAGTSHTVFAPLYPALIRAVGGLLGGQYLLAALLISNLSAIGYFIVFFALAEREVGPAAARRAQVYAALYPWAFVLLAGYSEALFLFLATLSFWGMWRQRWWVAGVCGALVALTRVQGAVLTLPLLFEALRQRRFRPWSPRMDLVWSLLPSMAGVGFLLWRQVAGLAPVEMVLGSHWNISAAWPWESLSYTMRVLASGAAHVTDYLDLGAALIFLALTVLAWSRLSPAYALFMTAVWWFSLSHIRVPHPVASTGRYMIELYPAFFLLGQAGLRSPWLNRLILYPSIALFLYLSAQFVLWGWVG